MRIHLQTIFELEFYQRELSPSITKEMRRIVLVRRYFCRRGKYLLNYDWLKLYKAIYDFKLLFRFKYNMTSKTLSADYIPRPYRWGNQMKFFQFYLKLLTKFKWNELDLRQVMFYLNKAKRSCYLGLITQNKKK